MPDCTAASTGVGPNKVPFTVTLQKPPFAPTRTLAGPVQTLPGDRVSSLLLDAGAVGSILDNVSVNVFVSPGYAVNENVFVE